MKFFNKIMKSEDGATAIEYGLIAALIAVAAIVAMGQLGDNLDATFNNVNCSITADTVGSLASKMAYTSMQTERFLALNGLTGRVQVVPGQKVKIVTY